jgi:signal transduction histidine kinase
LRITSNNIIGAILGYSEMVEPQLTPGTNPAQHIDEIRQAAERGRDLIDNILTFGRRRDARVQPVHVPHPVRGDSLAAACLAAVWR